MALGKRSACAAKERDKSITGIDGAHGWARLIGSAGAVHFAGGDAGNPHLRAFGAPYWPVTVVNGDGRALECLAGRDDLGWCLTRREAI
jgi:hypothetical protein